LPVELHENNGSLGADIGAKIYARPAEAFNLIKPIQHKESRLTSSYEPVYRDWLSNLNLKSI